MGKNPNLSKLDYLFDQGKDFFLSSRDYKEKTGAPLPKDNSYLKTKSAFAIRAEEKGYLIVEVKEEPVIERTVVLKKI